MSKQSEAEKERQKQSSDESVKEKKTNPLIHLVFFLLPILLTLGLYAKTTQLDFFHIDDPTYVVSNPNIKGFTSENVDFMLKEVYFANFSPAHLLSYAVDYQLAGLDLKPEVFHLSSNLWGAVIAGFVYLLAFMLTRNVWVSLFAGLLFAAHPAHVEAIAWISNRKDLVAAAFAIPSMLAYLAYRKKGKMMGVWLALSIIFFGLAEAGKQSVVVLPVIFFVFDLILEKRFHWSILVDKIPYVLIAAFFALKVIDAQPDTQKGFDAFVFGSAMLQHLWLLTGFGTYVIYRDTDPGNLPVFAKALIILVPAILLVLPYFIWRYVKRPWVALFYFLVLALIPSQVLNFIHPVSDRYIFFPSVAFCILFAWVIYDLVARIPKHGRAVAVVVLLLITGVWGTRTMAYVDEWNDPRSVWHGASEKSTDVHVFSYLGNHYQDFADQLGLTTGKKKMTEERLFAFATAVYGKEDDAQALVNEWNEKKMGGKHVIAFREYLLNLAWTQFELAVEEKGTLVMPNLFFRRGKLQMDLGNLEEAEFEFKRALEQANIHTYEPTRNELTVRSHYAMGLVKWRQKNYADARDLIQVAYDEQLTYAGNWVPDIERQLNRIRGLAKDFN